ncbi:MAG: hypothetical protein RJA31_986, partial [Actinomycetota bacterium]
HAIDDRVSTNCEAVPTRIDVVEVDDGRAQRVRHQQRQRRLSDAALSIDEDDVGNARWHCSTPPMQQ